MVVPGVQQRQRAVVPIGLAVIVHLAVLGLLLVARMDGGENVTPEAEAMMSLVEMVSDVHSGADAHRQGQPGAGRPAEAAQAALEENVARQEPVVVLTADQHRKVRQGSRPSPPQQIAATVAAVDGGGAKPETGSRPAVVSAAETVSGPETVVAARPCYEDNPSPEYPHLARRRGWQGRVVLDVTVLVDGSVGDVRLSESSSHDLLDRVAMKTVRRWVFTPERRGGRAGTARIRVPVRCFLQE
jgi:protein TonB